MFALRIYNMVERRLTGELLLCSRCVTIEGRTYNGEPEIPGRRLPAKIERFVWPKAVKEHCSQQDWHFSAQFDDPSAAFADLP